MREPEMRRIAAWIDEVVAHVDDQEVHKRIAGEVREMCRAFPAPGLGREGDPVV
jgi:glycine hydroxymethyltransferase